MAHLSPFVVTRSSQSSLCFESHRIWLSPWAVDEILRRHQPNDYHTDFELFFKPSNHAPQRDCVLLSSAHAKFDEQVNGVWPKARLRKNGYADCFLMLFVYIPCGTPARVTTLRRATASRTQEQAPQIPAFVHHQGIDADQATQHYLSVPKLGF